jgi:hypothetical protein
VAEPKQNEHASRIAPELRRSLGVSILLQTLLLLFSALVLDGGWLLLMTIIAEIVFWAWFGFIIFLRGNKPTHLDILAVKWGYPAIWIASLYGAQLLAHWRQT